VTQISENRQHDEVCFLVLHSIPEQEPCFQITEKYEVVMVEIKKPSDEQVVIRNGTR